MIGRLSGIVDDIGEDYLLLDVGGVGYIIFCSRRTLDNLPKIGQKAKLDIETHVREDHIHLYGFSSAYEKRCFNMLLSVQGVGMRVGLAILTVLPPQELLVALGAQDKVALARATGVGPKLANRIVQELKDKAGKLGLSVALSTDISTQQPDSSASKTIIDDALSALINLGYSRSQAFSAVATASKSIDPDSGLGPLLQQALKVIGT